MHDNFIELTRTELVCFSKQFRDYYKVVEFLNNNKTEINANMLEIGASIINVELDTNYLNGIENGVDNARETINAYVRLKEQSIITQRLIQSATTYSTTRDDSLLLDMEAHLQRIKDSKPSESNIVPFKDIKEQQLEFIERIRNREELPGLYLSRQGYKSYFPELSRRLRMIQETDLIIIAGMTGLGKTSFAISLMNQLQVNGYKGLMFTLEMPNRDVYARMTTSKSGINDDILLDYSTPLHEKAYAEYKQAVEELASYEMYITDKPYRSWLEMREDIIKYKDNIDYVIIDHIGLIHSYDGRDGNDTRNNVLTRISRDMKLLAIEIKKPIIVLSQFNRLASSGSRQDGKYQEVFLHDLRDSSSLEQDANKVLLLYRKKESQEERERHEKLGRYNIVCKIAKNREGSVGYVNYEFNAPLQRWREVDGTQ